MSNAQLSFRTITRCGIFRQVTIDSTKTLVPIALSIFPESAAINPNPSIETIKETACDGRMVPSFTYEKESSPTLELSFGMAVADLESLIHGRVVATAPTVETMVFAEFLPTSTTIPGRAVGQIGNSVVAQDAATSKAKAWYIDPTTKLAKQLTIVDAADTPTGDEIKIGAGMAFTVSSELVAAGREIYAWVPCRLAGATVASATPIGLISVFMQGVSFDNKARLMIARNCTRMESGGISSDPKRGIKLQILPDPSDGNGLGYQIIDTSLDNVC